MEKHLERIGTLWQITGVLAFLALAGTLLFLAAGALTHKTLAGLGFQELLVAVVFVGIYGGVGATCFRAGSGLKRHDARSRHIVIALSAIALFTFPIGTALGVYSLWTLTSIEARIAFAA